MGIASSLRQFLGGAPDPRSAREIEGDIDAELAFHLEQRELEFRAQGLSPEAAREAALLRFGNFDEVRAECRRVQLGGKLMLQRVTLVLLVVLLAIVAWLSFQSVASQRASKAEIQALHAEISQLMQLIGKDAPPNVLQRSLVDMAWNQVPLLASSFQSAGQAPVLTEEETSVRTWCERFRGNALSGSGTDETARSLRRHCSQDRALQVLPELWPELGLDQRIVLLDELVDGSGERLARAVVHLGATDADPRLVRRALERLRELTLLSFDADKPAEYLAWHAANKGLGLSEIFEKSAPELVKELRSFEAWNETCALYAPLKLHKNLPGGSGRAEILRDCGAVALVQAWARDPDPRARVAAIQWLEALEVDEVTARMIIMPMLSDAGPFDPSLVPAICQALVSLECTWAEEPLLALLGSTMRTRQVARDQLEPIASALGRMDTQRVTPTIIAWLVLAKDPVANEILGKEALEPLTGVEFDPARDVAWWLNWWSINRADYPNSDQTETGLPKVIFW